MGAFVGSRHVFYGAFFCAVLCLKWAAGDKIFVPLTSEAVKELKEQAVGCRNEYGLEEDILKKLLLWSIPNEESYRKFIYCLLIKTSYVNTDGHWNIDKMMTIHPATGTRDDYKNHLEECNKITKGDNVDTSYEMCNCFHKIYKVVLPQ